MAAAGSQGLHRQQRPGHVGCSQRALVGGRKQSQNRDSHLEMCDIGCGPLNCVANHLGPVSHPHLLPRNFADAHVCSVPLPLGSLPGIGFQLLVACGMGLACWRVLPEPCSGDLHGPGPGSPPHPRRFPFKFQEILTAAKPDVLLVCLLPSEMVATGSQPFSNPQSC